MKTKLYLTTTILISAAVLTLSSCLKDARLVDFSTVTPVVDFPLGGTENFGADAITETPDTDANGTIVRQFSVNIASVKAPTTATTVTLALDNTLVASYNALGGAVTYLPMPAGSFVFTATSVTIPAGQHTAIVSVTFYKNLLDPALSYMLPIKIVSASAGTISANFGVHYFHFIGNDFAGSYEAFFDRWPQPDTTINDRDHAHVDDGALTAFPVTPTEFTITTGYYTQPPYTVDFVKTGSGATATYSGFTVDFTAATIAADFTPTVTLVHHPEIRPQNNTALNNNVYDPNKQYTYAQSLLLFRFYYTTLSRGVIDTYVKN
jgi:hypothetical protein